MLTIRAMANGSGYSRNHLERNDYYAENEKVVGRWFGKGAAKLGLEGAVVTDQFEAVRQGLHPETGEMLRQRKSADRVAADGVKQSEGRNLYDLTFSAPKSVSIMAGPGGDERIVGAHDRAVTEALLEAERLAGTRVRLGDQNSDRTTGNLIVACYQHDASRQLDPQLHTHAVAVNATYDPVEQRWKALQAGAIYEQRAYLTAVYRNALARELQDLGYDLVDRIEKNRDLGFEIKGVSQELIDKFSQRSKQRDAAIAAFIEKTGRAPTDNEISILVRDSRPDKLIDISTAEVKAQQNARLTPEEAHRLADLRESAATRNRRAPSFDAEASLQHAMDHIFERVSVAKEHEVMAEALRHGRGGLDLAELKRTLQQQEVKGSLFRAGNEIATLASLRREEEMIAMVNRDKGKLRRLGGETEFQISDKLNPEQRQVVDFVLNSCDRVVNIQGAAGTGKTAALQELHRGLRASGNLVFAVAPTMSATDELRKVGIPDAMTVERLLQDKERHVHLPGRAVIVDEAGMVSGRQMHALLQLSQRYDFRLIFSGDSRQIASVEASDALRILEKESLLATAGLRQVQRQQNPDYKQAIKALRVDPARGFELLDRMGAVQQVGLLDRAEAVAAAFAAASGEKLVVCPTHEEIDRVTVAIRADKKRKGELAHGQMIERLEPQQWTGAQKRDLSSFVPGQILVFHRATKNALKGESFEVVRREGEALIARNPHGKEVSLTKKQARSFGVFERRSLEVAPGDQLVIEANGRNETSRVTNGERVKVAKVDSRGRIQLEDGRKVPLGFRQFNYGYAVTAHKSQGKSVDEVIVSGDSMSRELFYVAASRGRRRVQVFTGDQEILRAAVGVSGQRKSALELLRQSPRKVDRSRTAERPRTFVGLIAAALDKAWRNIPRLLLGQPPVPEHDYGLELHR